MLKRASFYTLAAVFCPLRMVNRYTSVDEIDLSDEEVETQWISLNGNRSYYSGGGAWNAQAQVIWGRDWMECLRR